MLGSVSLKNLESSEDGLLFLNEKALDIKHN